MNDDDKFTITIGDSTYSNTSTIDTIDLSDITTWTASDYTLNINDVNNDIITSSNSEFIYNTLDTYIDPSEVESMCKEYPALTKVWRNFKSVYDMVQQDYKGKKESGEINDPIPF